MRHKLTVLAVTALVTAFVTALTIAPAASAQPGVNIPVTCTVGTPPVNAACTLELIGFNRTGGVLNAVFRFTNVATGQVTRIVVPITQLPAGSTCTILELQTGTINLFLLGLRLVIDPIHIVLTAQRGTLLGDLLCGLFFGTTPLQALTGILNAALRGGLITVPTA